MTKAKMKILIIDDEPELVEILSIALNGAHEVITAYNGKDGLDLALAQNPDLIISDINMPQMDGLTMLEKLRNTGFKKPLIFVTAYSDVEKIKKAWKLGAFDFLNKPIDLPSVINLVKKALVFGINFSDSQAKSNVENQQESTVISLPLNNTVFQSCKTKAAEEGKTLQEYLETLLTKAS